MNMNYENVVQIVFSISFIGMGIVIFRKIPILVTLPELPRRESFISQLKKRIKNFFTSRNFSYELFLQKIIHQIRILTLKADNKTFNWLKKLRERYRRKRAKESDTYWEEIRDKTK